MNHHPARPRVARLSVPAALLLLFACGGQTADGDAAPADAPPTAAAGTRGAATQGDFEGVIHVATFDEGESTPGVLRIKGTRWRFETEMEGERAAIVRGSDGRVFSVSDSERQYAWFPDVAGEDEPLQFEATGESETVAGYECRYYRLRDPNGLQDGDQACVTTALGFAGMGPGTAGTQLDEAALRQQFRDGFMILKSRDAQGVLEYEVTRIERTAVPDHMFEPPAGYTELGRLPAGAGG
jgi:hypothetical protein